MSQSGDQSVQGSFEASLARLEEVVRRLESQDVPLEEAMRLFEEGVSLARACSQRLNDAERKIELLIEREDGTYALRPFAEPSAAEGDRSPGDAPK
jgi:exodeoxyribonuclease VII small subunit